MPDAGRSAETLITVETAQFQLRRVAKAPTLQSGLFIFAINGYLEMASEPARTCETKAPPTPAFPCAGNFLSQLPRARHCPTREDDSRIILLALDTDDPPALLEPQ